MPLARGFILLTYFAITCGILTAVNAALLHKVGGVPQGIWSVAPALVIAFLETLALLALLDRYFLRARSAAQGGNPDKQGTDEVAEGDTTQPGGSAIKHRSHETSS
jgi:hypothetical protein